MSSVEHMTTPASKMDNLGFDALAAAVIRQAVIDYWHDCVPGKYKRGKLSESQYKKFVQDQEIDRKKRLREVERFFTGEWYKHLIHDKSMTGERMMEQIKFMRTRGLKINLADALAVDAVA